MKKFLTLCSFIFLGFQSYSFAAWGDESIINRSSWVTTNVTLFSISSTTIQGGVFDGVVVSSSINGGTVQFYDSNGIQTSTIGVVSTQGSGQGGFYVPFEVRIASGLTFTTSGLPQNGINGISIIFKITRPN